MPTDVTLKNPAYELKKKVQKKHPEFTDSVDGLSIEDLKKNIITLSTYREQTLQFLESSDEIKSAKEQVKELTAGPNETLRALKEKISYVHALLEDRG